ncbi:hypothetical protein [Nitrospira sp.]|uniref:hypothetical protein n=1 Tax=Nitrospira sp. TaxID=70125 RepID=UPI003FCDF0AD
MNIKAKSKKEESNNLFYCDIKKKEKLLIIGQIYKMEEAKLASISPGFNSMASWAEPKTTIHFGKFPLHG